MAVFRLVRLSTVWSSTCAAALLAAFAPLQAAAQTFPSVAPPASAQSAQARRAAVLDEVIVIGRPGRAALEGGAGSILNDETLRTARIANVNEALRLVPGLFPREEEGLGLRPNISIRGLNPTRSTKVLLLEDGIPFGYAPYGDNASYYHPPVERFSRIEVLKGSAQVRFGPHTVGGVINYITADPPAETAGRADLTIGNRDTLSALGEIGTTLTSGTGILAHATHKRADGARDNIDSRITDATLKVTQPIGERQRLTLKATIYDENSDITYSGLTRAEYAADPRQNPFVNDALDFSRWGASLAHALELGRDVTLLTTGYYSFFDRDWWRQSSNSAQRPNDSSDPLCGGMANLLTTCGNEGRLRNYSTYGVESRIAAENITFGAVDFGIEAGARFHAERQKRVQLNGDTPSARSVGFRTANSGVRENDRRDVDALSAFVRPRFAAAGFVVTPGLRVERIEYDRFNRLTNGRGEETLTQWIPGLGLAYEGLESTVIFAGVHRGFGPPGVADIITPAGGAVNLDAEKSWNVEAGVRHAPYDGAILEATYFRMDFSNQIIPQSVAGGVGATLTNAGETLHEGLEAAVILPLTPIVDLKPFSVEVSANYTWLASAKFTGVRRSGVGGFGAISVSGNRLPYTPEHLWSAAVTTRHEPTRVSLRLEWVHTAAQFTDDLNTIAVTPDGQRGRIASNHIWNVSLNWDVNDNLTLFLTAKNLFDALYVVDRSRGTIPGNPRLVQGGASVRF